MLRASVSLSVVWAAECSKMSLTSLNWLRKSWLSRPEAVRKWSSASSS